MGRGRQRDQHNSIATEREKKKERSCDVVARNQQAITIQHFEQEGMRMREKKENGGNDKVYRDKTHVRFKRGTTA